MEQMEAVVPQTRVFWPVGAPLPPQGFLVGWNLRSFVAVIAAVIGGTQLSVIDDALERIARHPAFQTLHRQTRGLPTVIGEWTDMPTTSTTAPFLLSPGSRHGHSATTKDSSLRKLSENLWLTMRCDSEGRPFLKYNSSLQLVFYRRPRSPQHGMALHPFRLWPDAGSGGGLYEPLASSVDAKYGGEEPDATNMSVAIMQMNASTVIDRALRAYATKSSVMRRRMRSHRVGGSGGGGGGSSSSGGRGFSAREGFGSSSDSEDELHVFSIALPAAVPRLSRAGTGDAFGAQLQTALSSAIPPAPRTGGGGGDSEAYTSPSAGELSPPTSPVRRSPARPTARPLAHRAARGMAAGSPARRRKSETDLGKIGGKVPLHAQEEGLLGDRSTPRLHSHRGSDSSDVMGKAGGKPPLALASFSPSSLRTLATVVQPRGPVPPIAASLGMRLVMAPLTLCFLVLRCMLAPVANLFDLQVGHRALRAATTATRQFNWRLSFFCMWPAQWLALHSLVASARMSPKSTHGFVSAATASHRSGAGAAGGPGGSGGGGGGGGGPLPATTNMSPPASPRLRPSASSSSIYVLPSRASPARSPGRSRGLALSGGSGGVPAPSSSAAAQSSVQTLERSPGDGGDSTGGGSGSAGERRRSSSVTGVRRRAMYRVRYAVRIKTPEDTVVALHFYNQMLVYIMDVALGMVAAALLYPHADTVVNVLRILAHTLTHGMLRSEILWLMGWPAGFKLNESLDFFFGSLMLFGLDVWSAAALVVAPYAPLMFKIFVLSGVGGLTMTLSLVADLVAVIAFHVTFFYTLTAHIFRNQISAIRSMANLFRGRKRNVLRRRIDHTDFGMDQLLLGTLFFTLLVMLLPTIAVYYLFFAVLRVVLLLFQDVIAVLCSCMNELPLAMFAVRFWRPSLLPRGVWIDLGPGIPHKTFRRSLFMAQTSPPPLALLRSHPHGVSGEATYMELRRRALSFWDLLYGVRQVLVAFGRHYNPQKMLGALWSGRLLHPLPFEDDTPCPRPGCVEFWLLLRVLLARHRRWPPSGSQLPPRERASRKPSSERGQFFGRRGSLSGPSATPALSSAREGSPAAAAAVSTGDGRRRAASVTHGPVDASA